MHNTEPSCWESIRTQSRTRDSGIASRGEKKDWYILYVHVAVHRRRGMIFTPTPQGSLGWIVWLSKDQIKKKRRILFTFLVWDVYVHIDPCTSHGRGNFSPCRQGTYGPFACIGLIPRCVCTLKSLLHTHEILGCFLCLFRVG